MKIPNSMLNFGTNIDSDGYKQIGEIKTLTKIFEVEFTLDTNQVSDFGSVLLLKETDSDEKLVFIWHNQDGSVLNVESSYGCDIKFVQDVACVNKNSTIEKNHHVCMNRSALSRYVFSEFKG